MNNEDFDSLVDRLLRSDPTAAEELVAEYEPEIRRFIRFRLTRPQMRRIVESVDISQSVFGKFFVDIAQRGVCPESPEQLRMLLITMARNKLFDYARKMKSGKRDMNREEADGEIALGGISDSNNTPSTVTQNQELIEVIRKGMTQEDWELVQSRLEGTSWPELAEKYDSTPEAIRKRVSRIIESSARQLGEES